MAKQLIMQLSMSSELNVLGHALDRLAEQTREDQRIFAETLALAVSRKVRWGRTTAELKELLDDILARPGLIAVTIFDPDGQVVAATVGDEATPPTVDEAVRQALSSREAASILASEGSGQILRFLQPFRWPGGRTGALEVRQTLAEMEQEFRRAVRENIVSRLVVLALEEILAEYPVALLEAGPSAPSRDATGSGT